MNCSKGRNAHRSACAYRLYLSLMPQVVPSFHAFSTHSSVESEGVPNVGLGLPIDRVVCTLSVPNVNTLG